MTALIERLTRALAGRYGVERELGSGGMATVYLADDLKHGRKVAIKVLREDLAASLGADRFHREIRIAAALQHPHILPLYDSGAADGLLYYVMPYVPGTSLRQKLEKEGELPVSDAVRILRDIADALAAAHEHGVVHRDLKPENVMISGRHALVTDFGVAKAVSEATGRQELTTIGVALGTPTYMAPEQATADPHLDHRADIYAFGVMAYELLAGRPPFTGHGPQEILAAHVTAAAVPVTNHRASIPPVLASLVMRCLEKKPADRWQRADELIPQLEAALTPSGGTTPIETRPFEAAVTPTRPRWPVFAAVGGALMAVAIAAGWALRGRGVPLDPARVLVVPFEIPSASPELQSLQQRLEAGIVQGLGRTGLADATDSRTAIGQASFADTASAAVATASVARRLARDIGAALVVVGRILPNGDSAQVEAKLLSTSTGTEVVPIPTEAGTGSGEGFVNAVAQRLMGALALYRDPAWGSSLPGIRAPTYAAVRAFQRGNEAWTRRQFADAGRAFQQAFSIDTTFLVAAVRSGYALFNNRQFALVDSLGAALEPRRASMSPFETQYLNRLLAWTHGDLQAAYAAAREMARLAPQSNFARYTAARSAMFINRMEEAKAGLREVDVNSPDMMVSVDGSYGDACDVYHALGEHESELAAAREWAAHPSSQQPLRAVECAAVALAALGRTAAVDSLFPRLIAPAPGQQETSIVQAVRTIAELSWHGHDTAATRLSRVALQRVGYDIPIGERFVLQVYGGEPESAKAIADSLIRADGTDFEALVVAGTSAAMRKDVATATGMLARLERLRLPYRQDLVSRGRAQILALLGRPDEAVQMLQQAFAEGASFQGGAFFRFHASYDLEPLRGYPAYEAFVKPR